MAVKVIGLIELRDQNAFEQYRDKVGQTVELYKGNIQARGQVTQFYWNSIAKPLVLLWNFTSPRKQMQICGFIALNISLWLRYAIKQ